LLKLLTGGDTVAARFLYRETFEFHPHFKLWLAANARPRVSAADAAIWRRILQVPFVHVIPEAERDERVKIQLRTNPHVHSAILAWAVQGCLEWQEVGLAVPQSVRDYTNEYRAENDPLRDWLTDRCKLDGSAWTATADLRKSYEEWCETNGEKPTGPKSLATALNAKGCTPAKSGDARGWKGISVA
jgi:putative DNA primase/helicase